MSPISAKELNLFHRMDREIFVSLVVRLGRNPAQSLLIMALWFWLENVGHPTVLSRMTGLPDLLIDALAREAVACLTVLEADNPRTPVAGGLPLTSTLMQVNISLSMFNLKRFTAVAGIKRVLNNLCSRIFTDVLMLVLPRSPSNGSSSITSFFNFKLDKPLLIPGFPHPLFGDITIPPQREELDLMDMRIWGPTRASDDIPDDDKTMFLTFSRGFPVSKEEVKGLFTGIYGDDSLKAINMGNGGAGGVEVNDEALFATLVLGSVEIVDAILKGKRIAKFKVNGKHIWARKYERRDH